MGQLPRRLNVKGDRRPTKSASGPLAAQALAKAGIDFAAGAGVEEMGLQSRLRGQPPARLVPRWLGERGISWVDEHSYSRHIAGTSSREHLQPLCRMASREKIDAGQVALWSREACDKTEHDRVDRNAEHDGNCLGGCLGRERRGVPLTTAIAATCRRTKSAANAGEVCPIGFSAQRYSIADVLALDIAQISA